MSHSGVPPAPAPPGRACFLLPLVASLVVAAALRLAALPAEFWLDEIWSWEFARAARSPWEVLAGLRHDNNHKLNTLFLHFCPAGVHWAWYRLHSLVAGLASVGLAAWVARPRGRADAVFAGLLVAVSYWLVACSAEARGYALAIAFALLAFGCLRQSLDDGSRTALFLFWGAVVLGFLAHLSFIHCYLALGLWSLRRFARRRAYPGAGLVRLVRCHAVPAGFFVALYLLGVRGMELGGGPPAGTAEVLGRLLGFGLGGPGEGWPALPWVLLAAGVFVVGVRLLAAEGSDEWVFFAVVVAGAPALFLVKRPPFLFERYFLIPFVFFLVLLSHVLGASWRRRGAARLAAAGVLTAVVLGSAWHAAGFARSGRGQFLPALAWAHGHDLGGVTTVTGDYDFRVQKFCAFYAAYLGDSGAVIYRGRDELPPGGAGWLLVHRLDGRHPPGPLERDARGNEYRLEKSFPAAGYGSWGWYVYRNRRHREEDAGQPASHASISLR
jgi:hypothetical protein